ncbi:MAG: hypothetical protein EXR71_15480 [Myxococcales bacterium]|nr:hypothetical protein [Myxococcales bacterium]
MVVAIGVLALRMLEGTTVAGPVALRRATDGLTEMQGWLGWQVWDNLSHRRGLLDASVFLDGTASLWSVVGNPGVAALLAPLWGVLAPDAAGLLGFGLLATLNIVAGARFGAGHRVPWLGALAAAGVGAGVQLAGGGFPQALFGPGLLAAAALAAGHARLAVAWTLIGAALAPGPTAGMLLAVGGLPYAALAALGFAVAPFGSGAGPALIAADLFWPGGGAQSALPVAVGLALIALWQARGWSRLLVVLTAAGLLAGVVPEPVAGYQVVGGLAASSAPVAFALALLIGGALPLAATLTRARRTLLGACLVADLVGPVAVGGGRVLETASPVAPVLVSLARSPRRAEVVVIPDSAGAAGVGLIPHHLQHASRAPRLANDPSGGVPLNELRDHIRRSVRPVVVVLLEPEAGQASVLASAFGPPETYAAPMAVWR